MLARGGRGIRAEIVVDDFQILLAGVGAEIGVAILAVHARAVGGLRERKELVALREPKREIEVLAVTDVFAEAADGLQRGAGNERGEDGAVITERDVLEEIAVVRGENGGERGRAVEVGAVDGLDAEGNFAGRMTRGGEERGEGVGRERVVGIEELNPLAARGAPAGVARDGGTGVGLANEAHARLAELLDEGDGAVGGAVIDDDDFTDAIALGNGAGDGFEDEFFVVERGDDHADRAGGSGFWRGFGARRRGRRSGAGLGGAVHSRRGTGEV